MAAEVTGFIGNEQVELNNAATEATLKALLAATARSESGIKKAMDLAEKAGYNPVTIKSANDELKRLAVQSAGLDKDFAATDKQTKSLNFSFSNLASITDSLITGSANLSGVLGKMSIFFPGITGKVLEGFSRLAEFQESSIKTYRSITDSGVSFNGSLTDMRIAASISYLTLDELSNVIKSNSAAFANMGGNVNENAKAFSKVSNNLIKGDFGTSLMNMGYSFEAINEGLISYIQISGGRSAAEMADTVRLTNSTTAYLTELDQISALTGKSRKQQQDDLKKLSMNAAWENYIAKIRLVDPAKADQIVNSLTAVQGRLGEKMGAVFQATTMGQIGSLDQAGRQLYSLMTTSGVNFSDFNNAVQQGGVGIQDAVTGIEFRLAQSASTFDQTNLTLINRVGGGIGDFVTIVDKANTNYTNILGKDLSRATEQEAIERRRQQIVENSIKVTNAEIKAASESEKAIKNLGITILSALEPVLKNLSSVLKIFADNIVVLGVALVGLIAGAKLLSTFLKFTGAGSPLTEGLTKIFGERGHSIAKPMYVYVVNQAGSGVPGAPSPSGPAGGGAGKIGNLLSNLTKGLVVLQLAYSSYKGISGISENYSAVANGTMTKSAADKARNETIGNLVGSGIGMAAGNWLGKSTGALVGRVAGGLLGTLGGPVGAAAGMAAGSWLGGMAGEWLGGKINTTEETPKASESSRLDRELSMNNLAILKEQQEQTKMMAALLDISAAHYDIDRGTAPYLENMANGGGRSWVWGRGMR